MDHPASNRAGDLDDADLARLVLARALVAVQYGEADEVERALVDHLGPKDLPDDEVTEYGPTLLARTRLWLGDLQGARKICEQTVRSARHAEPAAGRADRRARPGLRASKVC